MAPEAQRRAALHALGDVVVLVQVAGALAKCDEAAWCSRDEAAASARLQAADVDGVEVPQKSCDLPHGLRPVTLGRKRGIRRARNAKFLEAPLDPPPLIDPPRDLDDLLRVDLAKRDAVNDLLRLR